MSEYYITLVIPRGFKDQVEQAMIARDHDYDGPIRHNTPHESWSFLVIDWPQEDLDIEDYLVENEIPFDRLSSITEQDHDGDCSVVRYYRPSSSTSDAPYDRWFAMSNNGEYIVPSDALRDILDKHKHTKNAELVLRDLRVLIGEYMPIDLVPLDRYQREEGE